MLNLSITLFIVAIIAAIFGFGGIAGAATEIAVLLFWIFVVLFVISFVVNLLKGKEPKL